MVDKNDYIYRFISGKLQDKRKHSEVINKILAGYIDSDGSISLRRSDSKNRNIQIEVHLVQSAINDPDFEVIRSFYKFYNLGFLTYKISSNPKESSQILWRLGSSDSIKLFNLIGKHLVVKGKHFKFCIERYAELIGEEITDVFWEDIKAEVNKSREENAGPLKIKKHPSWAWLAGYIAGDGHLCCRLNRSRKKFDKKVNKFYNMTYNELYVCIVDKHRVALDFIQIHLNGSVYEKKEGCFMWKRSLGKGHKSFSENFLSKIKPYMLHPHKYEKIKRMQSYLGLAETKQAGDRNIAIDSPADI